VSFAVDIICINLAKSLEPTVWIITLFTLLEGQLLFLFFYLLFADKKYLRITVISIGVLFLSLWIWKNFISGNIHQYDYFSQTLEFIFLLFLCLLYFFQNTKVTSTTFIYSYYEFWIVSALLMYCAGTFFSFFTPMSTAKEGDWNTQMFETITRSSSILKNIILAIAFSISNKKISNNSRNPNSIYYINDLKD
jgi:hypothetical protein